MGDMGIGGGTADGGSFPLFLPETESVFLSDLKLKQTYMTLQSSKYIIKFTTNLLTQQLCYVN